ncbi:MAG: HNH endonuclease [Lachnospiraceae bacterium]|jgi:5-methylcytosine-specific restriction endonuclease McrA
MAKLNLRPDHIGPHRSVYEKNRKIILATRDVCGICGQPVNKRLRYPDPMSATIDHIIPIDKGGSPDDIDNLQLAHMCCNRAKSDKLLMDGRPKKSGNTSMQITNRNLPQSRNWTAYRSGRS